jgi:hypothetical protein
MSSWHAKLARYSKENTHTLLIQWFELDKTPERHTSLTRAAPFPGLEESSFRFGLGKNFPM